MFLVIVYHDHNDVIELYKMLNICILVNRKKKTKELDNRGTLRGKKKQKKKLGF